MQAAATSTGVPIQVAVDALERHAGELAVRSVAAVNEDPWWDERFPRGGRRHAAEDGAFHVRHLCDSLRIESPTLFVRYARWTRDVLAARGMCTMHLSASLRRLALAIEALRLEGGSIAVGYIDEAERALRYDDGPARALQDATRPMVEALETRLASEAPIVRDAARLAEQVSFVADAIARRDTHVFEEHARFMEAFFTRHGASPRAMVRVLSAIAGVCFGVAPDAAEAVARITREAERVLETRSA